MRLWAFSRLDICILLRRHFLRRPSLSGVVFANACGDHAAYDTGNDENAYITTVDVVGACGVCRSLDDMHRGRREMFHGTQG